MAACIKTINDARYDYYTFSIDDARDIQDLPTMNTPGKGKLSNVKKACQGSWAEGTDGSIYTLEGKTNTWIEY